MNQSSVHLLGNAGQPVTGGATVRLVDARDPRDIQIATLQIQVANLQSELARQEYNLAYLIKYVYTPWPRKWLTWGRGY